MTDRDQELIQTMDEYGILTTKQIQKMRFEGIEARTVLRRLRVLERGKLITRIAGLPGGLWTWLLTAKGTKLAGGGTVAISVNRNTLAHDVLLNDIRLKLENCGMAVNWQSHYRTKRTFAEKWREIGISAQVIPDGIFAVNGSIGVKSVALELELLAKSKSRYRDVFSIYTEKDVNFLWYLVPSQKMGKALCDYWEDFCRGINGPIFVWSLIKEVKNDPLTTELRTNGRSAKVQSVWCESPKSDQQMSAENCAKPAHPNAHIVGTTATQTLNHATD